MIRPSDKAPATGMRSPRSLVWGVAILDLLLVAFAGWTLTWSRAQYVQQAQVATRNLGEVLEQNLLATIHQIDLVLLAVKDEAERPGVPDRGGRIEASLQAQFPRIPLLGGLRTADARGRVDHGHSPRGAEAGGTVDDREYFQYLKAHPGTGLFVSRPLLSRFSRKWVLVLARRLEAPGGGFAGIVFASLPLDSLEQRLAQIDVGRRGSISLRGADLALLARTPALPGLDRLIGNTGVEGEYQKAVKSGQRLRHFTARSRLDGEVRTYTLLRIADPPFYLLVSLSQAEYLHAWRKEAWLAGLAVLGLIALSAGMAWLARSTWRRHLADQARLAQEEARFRLLAENALDVVWTLDPRGRLTYISPSIRNQRGWTPEEFMALDPSRRALSRHYPSLIRERIDAAGALPPGSQPFVHDLLQVTVPCKDGREIQVEAQWQIVWGPEGSLLGFQGVTRDVTERKRMETERERLIAELTQALAAVKTLGGMLPICGQCKKIRDDQGYWSSLESYLARHTDATFTHGLCPDCKQSFRKEMRARRRPEDPGDPGPASS